MNGDANRFRHLVVGVDPDGSSDFAVDAAIKVAGHFASDVEFVCAAPPERVAWIGLDRGLAKKLESLRLGTVEEKAREGLERGARHFGHDARFLNQRLRVVPGNPADVLIERAKGLPSGIVFLGAHRKRGILELGDTARKVLHHVGSGVWMQPSELGGVQRILAPIDPHDGRHEEVLGGARELARRFEADVTALHVFVPPDQTDAPELGLAISWSNDVIGPMRTHARAAFDQALERFEWDGVRHEAAFVEGRSQDVILERSNEAQLVVMGTHGRSRIAGLLLGSVAHAVLRESDIGVLAFR